LENRKIDINDFPFKILSSFIVSLDYNRKNILICSMSGDIIEVQLTEAGTDETMKAQRINSVCRLFGTSIKAMSVLCKVESAIIIAGENGQVCTYDTITHELIDVWHIGASIASLATLELEEGGYVLAAGTDDGNVILR